MRYSYRRTEQSEPLPHACTRTSHPCPHQTQALRRPTKPTSEMAKASAMRRRHAPTGDTAPGHRPHEDPAQSPVVADDTRPTTIAALDAREHGPAQRPGRRDPLPDRGPAPREHPAQTGARALGAQARARAHRARVPVPARA